MLVADFEEKNARSALDTHFGVVLQNCCFIAKIASFYRIIFDHINKFGTLPPSCVPDRHSRHSISFDC